MKRKFLSLLALGSACVLAACGSATVESKDGDGAGNSAPLERAEETKTSEAKDDKKKEQDNSSSRPSEQADDVGAREVDEVPAPQVVENEQDAEYLAAVGDGGIDIAGIEDQIIGAGLSACNPQDEVTVGAVAGQLIEQQRTKLEFDKIVQLIEDNAHSAYC